MSPVKFRVDPGVSPVRNPTATDVSELPLALVPPPATNPVLPVDGAVILNVALYEALAIAKTLVVAT